MHISSNGRLQRMPSYTQKPESQHSAAAAAAVVVVAVVVVVVVVVVVGVVNVLDKI